MEASSVREGRFNESSSTASFAPKKTYSSTTTEFVQSHFVWDETSKQLTFDCVCQIPDNCGERSFDRDVRQLAFDLENDYREKNSLEKLFQARTRSSTHPESNPVPVYNAEDEEETEEDPIDPSLESTLDTYNHNYSKQKRNASKRPFRFIQNHFMWCEETSKWNFACRCITPDNCSVWRMDPSIQMELNATKEMKLSKAFLQSPYS